MSIAVPRARLAVRLNRGWAVVGILVVWLVGFGLFHGKQTLALAPADITGFQARLNEFNDSIGADRNSNPLFLYFFNEIKVAIDEVVVFLQGLISQPVGDRPLPYLGWLGVVALGTYAAWAFGNWRVALLTLAGLLFLGAQGLWQESMDTLALTITAVLLSLLVGIPLGIWAGLSDRFNTVVTPVLDLMQTMPTFVYLAPLTLLFLIGPAAATIATLIYAVPPVIRLTAHGIREVPRDSVEAGESLGSTGGQLLRKVLLPMAKPTIVIGINQTIMAALSMVTIAALIDAPGLGQVVVRALQTLDVGTAFNAGLSIVVLAVVLDRVTTAASVRVKDEPGFGARTRRYGLIGGGVAAAVCAYLSYTYLWAAEFPSSPDFGGPISRAATAVSDWCQLHLAGLTGGLKDGFTAGVIDPLEALLSESPWWLVVAVVTALAYVLGTWRTAVLSLVLLALLIGTGVWSDAMVTLAATLVATVFVTLLGLAFGVWMGRSDRIDAVIRPVLDAAQTMPPFVYLVPFLALFAPSRFTAIVAAVVYAAPVTIKIVADSIRAVSPTTVEAATSVGSSTWQVITKVQVPMARHGITLAVNQGLIYVLAMVVVGGLVGAGALGYDVVAGFVQVSLFGKGLAAGAAIVLLGILLDRITRAAAHERSFPTP
ncbi:ABC transporter permease [Cryptosporangium aurantiacum]|uniref:Glycine betaine/proline transport system permease protein n=1 Tax=Cryptosporangium aurantiacum TaxID=134849 RepID=A0A1M7M947_9ACTN|nr:ABC transporter permease subunit [Cryptosporangium aurantiacum]SHM87284.1 glycine betaine/proline transport system permease protein [Cryptosporangium aurantiacum]